MTETQKLWQPLAQRLVIPHDEASYQKLVTWLDRHAYPLILAITKIDFIA